LAGVLAVDVRAAMWYQGHGIGTYASELFGAMPPDCGGRRILGWCQGRWSSPGEVPPGHRGGRKPLSGRRFWNLAARPPELSGNEDLWHNPHSGLGSPGAGPGPPLVVTVHDLIPLVCAESGRSGFVRAFREQVPGAVGRAAGVIAVSGHTRDDLIRVLGVPSGRITVIPEAPPGFCRPVARSEAREHVLRLYGIRAPFFLYVGGFSARKNVRALVQAFSVIAGRLWGHELLLIAGAPDRTYAQVQALAHRLRCTSRVAFLGRVEAEDLPYLYSGAEAFIYPSLYEGFGLPPMEAMACGCPVICSDATSLPEVCGDAALLVDARDVDAIAGAIREVAECHELATRLRERGLERARAFSWRTSASRTLNVYSQVLGAGSKPEGS